jgi:hypothetical protein
MKTLRILIALCIILGFATNNAYSQKTVTENICHWEFTPPGIPSNYQLPCLTEVVSGDVFELQYDLKYTYHVPVKGVLKGQKTGDEYEISYNYNEFNKWRGEGNGGSFHWVMPILLKHEGKLVAVIHDTVFVVCNGQGEVVIQLHHTVDVNCK